METLKKAVENRNVPFEFGGKTGKRGRVISLRVSERMEQLLEEQAQEWNMSTSDTLRSILNFYFLPPLLLEAWESKVEELVEIDLECRGMDVTDSSASTQAQRIEEVFLDSEEAEEYAEKNYIEHEDWQDIVCASESFNGNFYTDERGTLHEGYPC